MKFCTGHILKSFPLLFFLLTCNFLNSQADKKGGYVYNTPEQFYKKEGIYNPHIVIKKDLAFNKKKYSEDKNRKPARKVFFTQSHDKSQIRNVFAVKLKDKLYFQVSAIRQNRARGDLSLTLPNPNAFIEVLTSNDSLYYSEMLVDPNNMAPAIAGGITMAIIVSQTSENLRPFVYNTLEQKFEFFRNCKDINQFLKKINRNDLKLGCSKKSSSIEEIRNVLSNFFSKETISQFQIPVKEEFENITFFPHKTMIGKVCNLSFEDQKVAFDDLDLLEVELGCNNPKLLQLTDSQEEFKLSCYDKSRYYMISYDSKKAKCKIDFSTFKQFEYFDFTRRKRLKKSQK